MGDRFKGRTALVTGASRGIGAGIAQRLAAEGADLAIVARTLDHHPTLPGSLNETAELCRRYGVNVEVIVADLSDGDARATIVPRAVDAIGPIDILVNNAAAAIYARVDEYPLRRRRVMTEMNIHAPIDLAQAALPAMVAKGEGWIINLSSASSEHPMGPPYDLGGVREVFGFYGATKAMLNRVTTALASEVHTTGVRVNTIEPRAAVLSEGAAAVTKGTLRDDQLESLEAMVEATLVLCDCGPDHTGRIESSLDLLEQFEITVMTLDGSAPHPNGFRP